MTQVDDSDAFRLLYLRESQGSNPGRSGIYAFQRLDEQGNETMLVNIAGDLRRCRAFIESDGTTRLEVDGVPQVAGPLYGFGVDTASAVSDLCGAYDGVLALADGDPVADWVGLFP